MKKFDLRLIVFVGALIFGGSCLMKDYMNPQYGGPQFQLANIVRALGKPFRIGASVGGGNRWATRENRRTDRLSSIS